MLADDGLVGPGGDFGDEVVSELIGRDGVVGFDVLHDAVEAVLFVGGVGGFREAVGVKDVAVAGLEREFEGGVFGFVNHS